MSGVVRNVDGTPALLAMVIARTRSGDIAPMMGTSFAGITNPDGSFAVANVPPGAYVVEAQATSAARGGSRALISRYRRHRHADRLSGGDVNGLEVVLTSQKIELSGVVTNDRGATVTDATVVACADDPDKWGPQTRFIESARLDQNGRFKIQGLPAGAYVVVATDDMEPGEERDPEVLEQLRSKGSRITLRDGEIRTLDARVVSY